MNFDFQMIKKVRDLLMDDNSRALYDLGGCVDNEGDNILLHIKPLSWDPLDRPIHLIIWVDSQGLLHHHLPIYLQQAFNSQIRYLKGPS